MRQARLESQAQRLARPEQVLLADNLIRRLRPKLFSKGSMDRNATVTGRLSRILGKQVVQGHFHQFQARDNNSPGTPIMAPPRTLNGPTNSPAHEGAVGCNCRHPNSNGGISAPVFKSHTRMIRRPVQEKNLPERHHPRLADLNSILAQYRAYYLRRRDAPRPATASATSASEPGSGMGLEPAT